MSVHYLDGDGKEPIKVSSVIAAVKTIVALGDEQEFAKLCEERKLDVIVDIELINLIKKYLLDQESATETLVDTEVASLARRIRECDDTFNC